MRYDRYVQFTQCARSGLGLSQTMCSTYSNQLHNDNMTTTTTQKLTTVLII